MILIWYDGAKKIAVLRDGSLAEKYVWQPESSGDADVILFDGGGVYATDANKNVTAYFIIPEWPEQPNGTYFTYSPFGEPHNGARRFAFSSEEWLGDYGLIRYLYRDYSPSLKRFLTRDPIGENGGVNLYNFVGNSPVTKWDNLGNAPAIRGLVDWIFNSARRVANEDTKLDCGEEKYDPTTHCCVDCVIYSKDCRVHTGIYIGSMPLEGTAGYLPLKHYWIESDDGFYASWGRGADEESIFGKLFTTYPGHLDYEINNNKIPDYLNPTWQEKRSYGKLKEITLPICEFDPVRFKKAVKTYALLRPNSFIGMNSFISETDIGMNCENYINVTINSAKTRSKR